MAAASTIAALREQHSDEPHAGVLLPRACGRASAPAPLPHHAHERAHARDHPRGLRPLADVHRRESRASARATARRSRTRSTASRTRARTRSSSSPRGWIRTEVYPNGISTSLPFDVQLALRAQHPRLRARPPDAPGLRDRIRLLRSARPLSLAGDAQRRRACSSPARSTAPPVTRRRPRRGCWRGSTPRSATVALQPGYRSAQRGLPGRAGR